MRFESDQVNRTMFIKIDYKILLLGIVHQIFYLKFFPIHFKLPGYILLLCNQHNIVTVLVT